MNSVGLQNRVTVCLHDYGEQVVNGEGKLSCHLASDLVVGDHVGFENDQSL